MNTQIRITYKSKHLKLRSNMLRLISYNYVQSLHKKIEQLK